MQRIFGPNSITEREDHTRTIVALLSRYWDSLKTDTSKLDSVTGPDQQTTVHLLTLQQEMHRPRTCSVVLVHVAHY
jgi:hypothetical protein